MASAAATDTAALPVSCTTAEALGVPAPVPGPALAAA